MTPHLEEGTLHALLDGEIPSSGLGPIQEHLAECAECRSRLADARAFRDEADQLVAEIDVPDESAVPVLSGSRSAAPTARQPRLLWRRLAYAASLLGAVGLGYAARGGNRPDELESFRGFDRADRPAATANAPVTPPAEPDRPARADSSRARSGSAARASDRAATPATREEARSNLAERETRERSPAAEPRVVTAAAAPAPAPLKDSTRPAEPRNLAAATLQRRYEPAAKPFAFERSASAVADAVGKAAGASYRRIEFEEAMRLLGGRIRLVEGLVPDRLEALGDTVRVAYGTGLGGGTLYLQQFRAGDGVAYVLIPPPGFPAESLARLTARIRP
ncbi:MAG: anti-sigma factor family protein [Gemmatimonadales bacterium]